MIEEETQYEKVLTAMVSDKLQIEHLQGEIERLKQENTAIRTQWQQEDVEKARQFQALEAEIERLKEKLKEAGK